MKVATKVPTVDRFVTVPKKGFKDLTTRSFRVKAKGKVFEGFVVKKDGKFFAYQNLCQHLPITLDLRDNNFFSHDRKYLQCHMHGAMYKVESGLCIAGPCEGSRLLPLEFKEDDQQLLIQLPE